MSVDRYIKQIERANLVDYVIRSLLTCVLLGSILFSAYSLIRIVPVIKEIRTQVQERGIK